MKPIPFIDELVVTPEVIDDLNHVNNVTYLQWVQDIGEKHWKAKAPEDIRKKYGWVVLNHYIEYKYPAFEGETLTLKTWIENYGGVKSERRTEIYRQKDQKIVAKAKTLWCFIDLEKQKPQRIQPKITEPFFES
ncbi:acyl-CoA thioester hydrolase [Mesonia algae]|jgi:acyl-CoA thioester hydrolase|uniref:Acyl-CoA thioester hydrolase n=1 Tax=Mesonia algae TaxID=213248 RepID=A0A2W7IXQ0_9FLAO|nr:acyl-CoA thioesterase [Mesonia algae]PZW44277.1 acyl-CoA thioester hydrolase [Mesonia algae]